LKLVPVRLKGTVRRVVGSRNLRGRKESGGKQELERKEGEWWEAGIREEGRRVVGSRNLRGRKESGGKQELERKEGEWWEAGIREEGRRRSSLSRNCLSNLLTFSVLHIRRLLYKYDTPLKYRSVIKHDSK